MMRRLPKVTPTPIPAFWPVLSPVREADVPAARAVEVWEEEKCLVDDGMNERVTVAGTVAVTVISIAYVVGRPLVDDIVRLGPSTP